MLLTREWRKLHVKKNLNINILEIKYCKVKDHCCYRGAAHSIFNSKYSLMKKIPIIFHNGSCCDYRFIA